MTSYRLFVKPAATSDLDQAVAWYEDQKSGLGLRLLAETTILLERVQRAPLEFPIVHRSIRRALLSRFPYGIFFIMDDGLHPRRASPERGGRMTRDPIVEEVRATRDEIARAFDYDVDAIFDALREMEREGGRRVVSLPSRRPFADVGENAAQPVVPADE